MRRLRSAGFALACAAAVTGCGGGSVPATPATPMPTISALFVAETGLNSVAVVNPVTNAIEHTIAVGKAPVSMGFAAPYLYVANGAGNSVSVVDTRSFTVTATIPVGMNPTSIAVDYTGQIACVTNHGDGTVSVIDLHKNAVIATETAPPGEVYVGIDQEGGIRDDGFGQTFYALSDGSPYFSEVWSVNDINSSPGKTKPTVSYQLVNGAPTGFVSYPAVGLADFNDFWITMAGSNQIKHIVFLNGTPQTTGVVQLTYKPAGITMVNVPNVYAAALVPNPTANSVTLVDLETAEGSNKTTVPGNIMVGNDPVSISADGMDKLAYVANAGSDSVSIVSTASLKVVNTIALPSGSAPQYVLYVYRALSATPEPIVTAAPHSPTPAPTGVPTATPTPGTVSNSTLYVANTNGNDVLAFANPLSGTSAPARTITYPAGTTSVQTDGSGTLAVAANSNIYLYNGALTASSTPIATLYTGSDNFTAFDPAGNLYATTFGQAVYKYAKPFSSTETPTLLYLADHGVGITFDASGNMYIANANTGDIDVAAPPYASNSQTVVAPPAAGAFLSGIAISNGILYVADTGNQAIYAYNLPLTASSHPFYTYAAADPEAIAFDSFGNLYVADDLNDRVDVYYAPSPQAPLQANYSIGSSMNSPFGLAFGP